MHRSHHRRNIGQWLSVDKCVGARFESLYHSKEFEELMKQCNNVNVFLDKNDDFQHDIIPNL